MIVNNKEYDNNWIRFIKKLHFSILIKSQSIYQNLVFLIMFIPLYNAHIATSLSFHTKSSAVYPVIKLL